MPRKASTIAPAVRIRENQRRARARRKELIEDLKSRNRDYETKGVMATAQVQEAARKVLRENRRLRALLAEKGVPMAEIEAYLLGYDRDAPSTVNLPTSEPADTVDTQSQEAPSVHIQQPAQMHASDSANEFAIAASPPSVPVDGRFESASREFIESSSDIELSRLEERSEEDLERGSPLPNLLGHFSDCYCPEIEPVPGPAQSSEMECSAAANILASFRGHGDAEQARVELGCPNMAQCTIANAALLHALDSGA